MAYSFAQLEGLWIQAGGSKALAPVMAAIALAESGGNPDAENKTDNGGKQTSWGLWQISNGTHSQPVANILSPQVNARQAVAKYKAQGLSAWGTYTSGKYKNFLGSAAPQNVPAGIGTGLSGSAPSAPAASSGSSGGLWGWIQAVWTGIGVGAAQTQIGQDTGVIATLASQFGGLGAVAQSIVGLSGPLVKAGEAIDWFFVPSHWVRLLSGAGGTVLVGVGLINLSHAGKASAGISEMGVNIPLPSGDMALALGIGEVGLGAVLLFVAFHNVPSSVTTFGEFLGFLQGKASSAVSATTSPAGAATTAAASPGGGG